MPLVEVTMWAGVRLEVKKRLAEGITKVFEELGIPREAVTVVIREVPKENRATGVSSTQRGLSSYSLSVVVL
ncbi:MAG: tautomerase family protein [Sulfolobales archaeon]